MQNAIARIAVPIAALSVAACGGQANSIPGPGVRGPAYATQAGVSRPLGVLTAGVRAQTPETVLCSFAGGTDGAEPQGALTDVNGVLYGTTAAGGDVNGGSGTVFEIAASGAESVLYRFKGGSDGSYPTAGLTDVDGVLYGTTAGGGIDGQGTVFKITTSGAESVIYRFKGGSDGSNPQAELTNVNGVLYGTTRWGGDASENGTVFEITTSGLERVLYRFGGGSDGASPWAGVINVNGVLYGTTQEGGANNQGTVFKITTSGAESVLYRFAGGSDGSDPLGDLVYVNGVLYGTTDFGGSGGQFGPGTVFKITMSGTEKILHSFGGGSDGGHPFAGLTDVNGALYGTTQYGGVDSKSGTAFKITTAGVKSALYRFQRGTDGSRPIANFTNVNGVLYGTTDSGGANNHGTVFSLSS